MNADFKRTDRLVDRFLECTADRHNLAGCFHLCAELAVGVDELVERPARNFADDIIQRRFEAGIGLTRYRVDDFIQRVAERDLGRHLGDRIAGRFGGQRRGAADTGIYFDNIVLVALRIERELHIAAPLDVQSADDLQGSAAQHLILAVGQRLARSHDDTIARMHADRIEVLHVADHDAVIVRITHDFIFDFFHAGDALLDQTLADRAVANTGFNRLAQLVFVRTNAAARSAQRVGRTNDNRVADFSGEVQRFFQCRHNRALRHRLLQLAHQFAEQVAVLGLLDGMKLGAQQLDVLLLQYAGAR
ncbi:hypothetical protein D3C71_1357120 [compost metagenome]